MNRPAQPRAAPELDSITSSFLQVRILHYASRSPATAASISDRLGPHAAAAPARTIARMTRNGLLKLKSSAASRAQSAPQYSLTPKGRRLLASAKKHLRHFVAQRFTNTNKNTKQQ